MEGYTQDCQTLLGHSPPCFGWLRKENALHKCGESIGKNIPRLLDFTTKVTQMVPWDKRFVVLSGNVIFIFKEETSKKPEKFLRLCDLKGIEDIDSELKDIPWPFRMIKKGGQKDELFAAMSRDERKRWLDSVREMMNNLTTSESDYESPDSSPERTTKKTRGPLPELPGKRLSESDIYEDVDNEKSTDSKQKVNSNNNKFVKRWGSEVGIVPTAGKSKSQVPVLPSIVQGQQGIRRPKPPPPDPLASDKPKLVKPVPPTPPNAALALKVAKKPVLKLPDKPKASISPSAHLPSLPVEEYSGSDGIAYELDVTQQRSGPHDKAMWHGSPEEATAIMAKLQDQEGAFLLRVASKGSDYTMHVICAQKSVKFSIREQDNKYQLGGNNFRNLAELIRHYKDNKLPNHNLCLGRPYSELQCDL